MGQGSHAHCVAASVPPDEEGEETRVLSLHYFHIKSAREKKREVGNRQTFKIFLDTR